MKYSKRVTYLCLHTHSLHRCEKNCLNGLKSMTPICHFLRNLRNCLKRNEFVSKIFEFSVVTCPTIYLDFDTLQSSTCVKERMLRKKQVETEESLLHFLNSLTFFLRFICYFGKNNSHTKKTTSMV